MILPGMGVVSELITCFSRNSPFGYRFIAISSIAIAVFGFLVWGHHMFVSGQSVYDGMIFSLLSFVVAIPSAVKVFSWTATLYKGSISWETPMLYAMGFVALFTIGGLTGLMLATLPIDVHVTIPILSWHIFITSWLAAPSWPIWVACTFGGRRSQDVCIPKDWAKPRRLLSLLGLT